MAKCRIIYPENAFEGEFPKICFNGEFTDSIREIFKAHRLRLGVSLQQLGRFLQINWSTIRKWESGKTRRCHAKHITRVNAYLNHEYDARLRLLGRSESSLHNVMERVPVELQGCLEQAWVVFGVSCCYPGEEEIFLRGLGETLDYTSKRLLSKCIKGASQMAAAPVKYVAEESAEYSAEPPETTEEGN